MFLDKLNEDQKPTFLALATRLVMADGQITPEEQELLQALKDEMGGNVTAPAEQVFGNTNTDVFADDATKAVVMFELLSLAFSDEDLATAETEVLHDVRETFALPEAEFSALEVAAKKRVARGGAADAEVKAEVEGLLG